MVMRYLQKWQLKVVVRPQHMSLVFGHDILVTYYITHNNIQGLVHSITIPIALLI